MLYFVLAPFFGALLAGVDRKITARMQGRLAVCGTVNDLLMRGAVPKYITSAFIIEEGADTDTLEAIASSMSKTASEAGVCIVACDTKAIEGNGGIDVHCMRDFTRGGLGTVLNELANASQKQIEIEETAIPITDEVRAFSKILGLNIMHMGNEGKLVAIVPNEQANKAVEIMKNSKYGENATIIGKVTNGEGVMLNTRLGGQRKINVLIGEGLPRIC